MKWAYYNEIDEYCVAWLRNLITAGLIPDGEVDSRSITDVAPDDVRGFRQQHYFAGIGVWAHALRLAGYPDDREVWTGSCPCQPFSGAGKRAGFDDERHLWPAWFKLIEERRPVTVFGEQVASPHALAWLDLVCDDLEGAGYAAGAIDFPACGVGAPHIRQRLWWVADSQCDQWRQIGEDTGGRGGGGGAEGLEQRSLHGGALNGFWSTADWLLCRDGKHRPAQPGTRPLAHGVAARVGRLRAYGNAITAPAAAEFIAAFEECRP
jgi:DNA (cytosine-5)-methyltransferase 1